MLSPTSPIPLYHQLAERLRQDIFEGKIEDGEPCCSDRELVKRYGLSLITVRHAIAQLVKEGLLERQHGRGTFVTARAANMQRRRKAPAQRAILFVGWSMGSLSSWDAMYFRDIYEGLEREAVSQGLRVTFDDPASLPGDPSVLSRTLAGVIVLQGSGVEERARELLAKGLKVVTIESQLEGALSVRADSLAGGRMAVEHLLSLGHRRLVHLHSGEVTCHWSEVRRAYREAVAGAGLTASENPVVETRAGGGTVEAGYEAARVALDRAVRPTGLFAGNDLMAIGALRLLHERNVRVPDEVSVIGFDNVQAAEICSPALTTIGVDRIGIGRRAVQMLLDPAVRAGSASAMEAMPVSLVVRGSTGPAPKA
jgi:DNA-binding LacI/PurR family transcriptional regulator